MTINSTDILSHGIQKSEEGWRKKKGEVFWRNLIGKWFMITTIQYRDVRLYSYKTDILYSNWGSFINFFMIIAKTMLPFYLFDLQNKHIIVILNCISASVSVPYRGLFCFIIQKTKLSKIEQLERRFSIWQIKSFLSLIVHLSLTVFQISRFTSSNIQIFVFENFFRTTFLIFTEKVLDHAKSSTKGRNNVRRWNR